MPLVHLHVRGSGAAATVSAVRRSVREGGRQRGEEVSDDEDLIDEEDEDEEDDEFLDEDEDDNDGD